MNTSSVKIDLTETCHVRIFQSNDQKGYIVSNFRNKKCLDVTTVYGETALYTVLEFRHIPHAKIFHASVDFEVNEKFHLGSDCPFRDDEDRNLTASEKSHFLLLISRFVDLLKNFMDFDDQKD